jgi:hypothetical protein
VSEIQLEIAKTVREAYARAVVRIKQGQGSDPILQPRSSRNLWRGWDGRHRAPQNVGRLTKQRRTTVNSLILCTVATLNIFSAPAGNQVVGTVPAYKQVYLMDGSLLRDWVFVGKPGPEGVSPRGWVTYAGLGQCQ